MLSITPQQLNELCRTEAVEIIDVRTPAEFHEAHIPSARNVPLEQLAVLANCADEDWASRGAVHIICRSGRRSEAACRMLVAAGCTNAVSVEGGMLAWEKAGFPVVRNTAVVSMERQVRVAAGLLILLGSTLSYFIHPAATAITAFIGFGLLFAGITDTCGMARILTRMPWNHVRTNTSSQS